MGTVVGVQVDVTIPIWGIRERFSRLQVSQLFLTPNVLSVHCVIQTSPKLKPGRLLAAAGSQVPSKPEGKPLEA